jgi:hypothetical protein
MADEKINSYELSRDWFNWCFENPEIINPSHTAIYFFAIEHCNRLGWKNKFGFPTQMTMDALGIKKHQTYIKYFNDLVDWGFLKLVQKSTNQYSANIISLLSDKPKNGKALDKAFITHAAKQTESSGQSTGQSTGQSNSSIDKQITNKQDNQEQINNENGFFRINDEVIFISVSEFLKSNYSRFIEQWCMKNKEPILNDVYEDLDTKYHSTTFAGNNHVKNAFTNTWKILKTQSPKSKIESALDVSARQDKEIKNLYSEK